MVVLYDVLKPLLFKLEPEAAHTLTLRALRLAHRLRLPVAGVSLPQLPPLRVMGLEFPNPIGLAAGLDKDGAYIDALAALGFGFIEIGTVTPRPQPGNPRPRLFRLPEHQAIINRMGFNNAGLDAVLANVRRAAYRGVLGINIGKNFDTPIESAQEDYLVCMRRAYPHASYLAVNISSPNTAGLRNLQEATALQRLLEALKSEQRRLTTVCGRRVPLVVKIAPDLSPEQVEGIARIIVACEIDGLIATNTTVSRQHVADSRFAGEQGGLSGAPLRAQSTQIIRLLRQCLPAHVPIIGAGGILSGDDAMQKFAAGADLIQVYTGLIYRGPRLVVEIAECYAKQFGPALASS